MDLATYTSKGGHAEYEALAKVVESILKVALAQHSELHLQQVQRRAKAPSSLAKKLDKLGATNASNIQKQVKDLAGCRLVFYTNRDVARFQRLGLLSDLFDIDWDRTKVHHPVPGTASSTELFVSNNYVVRLKKSRLALPEFRRFKGMACEVQVQTILQHAWAEMAHDTIYKRLDLKQFGGTMMAGIEERMAKIMRDHLLPAGHDFQKVADDFEELSKGKALFDTGPIDSLLVAKDNDERVDLLSKLKDLVLPNIDDPGKHHEAIRKAVVKVVLAAFQTPTPNKETPFGSFQSRAPLRVLDAGCDVLDRLRYASVDSITASLDALSELFAAATDEAAKKRLLQSVERLAQHNLDVWKVAGAVAQKKIVERLREFDPATLITLQPLVTEALGAVLRPEMEGTSSTFNSLILHFGPVLVTPELTEARAAAISMLKEMLRGAKSNEQRLPVLHALAHAFELPRNEKGSAELLERVLSDAADIVSFYTDNISSLDYQLRQKLEHDLYWLSKHRSEQSPGVKGNRKLVKRARQLRRNILAFRDTVNASRSYRAFKILVGFDSVFPPHWTDPTFDISGQDKYRERATQRLIGTVTPNTAARWLKKVAHYASVKSDDGATFLNLGKFLEGLAKAKPNIVVGYLDELPQSLKQFLPAMLLGLDAAGYQAAVRKRIKRWISRGEHSLEIFRYWRFAKRKDPSLMRAGFAMAVKAGDDRAVWFALNAVAMANDDALLRKSILVPAIRYLDHRGNRTWETAVWPQQGPLAPLKHLTRTEAAVVLRALARVGEIDYRAEEILACIATRFPKEVVDCLTARITTDRKATTERFDAIPYKFHKLHISLAPHVTYILQSARKWQATTGRWFEFGGGRAVAALFPEFPAALETALQKVALTGKPRDVDFITAILRHYEGNPAIHSVCKTLVDALAPNDSRLAQVAVAIDSTGTVMGEFGFVEAYQNRVKLMEPWLKDSRKRVKRFAQKHILSLQRQIASEQRASEEALELRKREYGAA